MDDFEDWYRTYYSNYKAKKNAVKGGVYYSKRYDAWKAKIYYKGDLYYLGQFKAKSEAEELLYEAQKHYHTDFMEWYLTLCSEKYVSRRNVYGFVYQNQNRNSVTWRTQFKIHGMFYFLGTYGTEEDAKKILREAESHVDDFEDWYYAYHDNYTALENASRGGVYYNKSADAWKSQISYQGQLYYLGQFKVKTKAEELLNEAQNHYYTDFLEWFEDMKKERKRSPGSGVKRSMPEETIHQIKDGTDESDSWGNIYRRKNGWVVQGSFQGKLYYLGKYEIKEDAEKVLKEAGAHVTDFEDWYENYYVQGYLLAKRGGISYNETSNTWKVQIHYKDKLYYLGLFQMKSEAEEMLKEAQEHYHTDFLEWYEENRRKRKKIVHQV